MPQLLNRPRLMNLILGIQHKDQRLYEALREIVMAMDAGFNEIETQQKLESLETGVTPEDVEIATYRFTRRNVILEWVSPNPDEVLFFDVRRGTNWDTADRLIVTPSTQAIFNPLPVGTTTYLIRTLNADGVYSPNPYILNVVVPPLGAISLQAQVIDNNVLLKWTEPTSTFDIDHYEITKEGNVIGTIKGTFATFYELVAGVYEYGVSAVDIAGNHGPEAFVSATVTQPPDFEIHGRLTDDFSGTKVNAVKDVDRLLAPVYPAETWAQHFSTRSWANIQAQLDAGYPIYAQPANVNGSYEQIFDFGAVITDTLIHAAWSEHPIVGHVAVTCQMATSTDGSTYTPLVTGSTIFASSVRYVFVKLIFTPDDDKSLTEISDLVVTASLKREIDSGDVILNAGDAGGTVVYFNKPFKDVDSITITADSLIPIDVIYDFLDAPNPVSFSVYAFDNAGKRITILASWKARGIV